MLPQKLMPSKGIPKFVSSQVSTGTNTTVVATAPTSIRENNILIAVINANIAGTAALTAPAGWTVSTNATNRFICYKTATASEGASYTFTLSIGGSTVTATILNYLGGKIDIIGTSSAAGTNPSAPSITPSQNNAIVLLVCTSNVNANTFTAPSGWTKRAERTAASAQAVFEEEYVAAISTGDIATTSTTSGARAGLVSLIPL